MSKKIFAHYSIFIHNQTTMNKNKKPLSQKIAAAASKISKAVSAPAKTPEKKQETLSLKKEKKVIPPIDLSREDIALRAYFIGERRRELGWDGNEQTDWIDAEKQLLAETLEKKSKK